jgi:dihydroxyacetone kinase DhaKLM complex PTS-EIIA-like component DhaM
VYGFFEWIEGHQAERDLKCLLDLAGAPLVSHQAAERLDCEFAQALPLHHEPILEGWRLARQAAQKIAPVLGCSLF